MKISDTIYYRADGTVSSIQRVTRETFTKPSGAEGSEDITTEVTLDALPNGLADAYAGMEAQNRALEAQLVSEREAAAADKEALRAQLQGQIDTLTQTIKAADAAWDETVRAAMPG